MCGRNGCSSDKEKVKFKAKGRDTRVRLQYVCLEGEWWQVGSPGYVEVRGQGCGRGEIYVEREGWEIL